MALFQATALATNDKSLARNGKALPTIDAYLLAVSSVQRGHGNSVPFLFRFLFRYGIRNSPLTKWLRLEGEKGGHYANSIIKPRSRLCRKQKARPWRLEVEYAPKL